MSATRLLVLGAIRIMQPVHGYDVRRELLSWRLEEYANIKPGSVYSAIRTLLKDGCLSVTSREADDARPEKTSYVVTAEGEKEFQLLLRQTWWTVESPVEPLIPALCLLPFMSRAELIRALAARVTRLEAELESIGFLRASIRDGATGADGDIPEHVRETLDFVAMRARGEAEWSRTLQRRLRDGSYVLVGDESSVAHSQS